MLKRVIDHVLRLWITVLALTLVVYACFVDSRQYNDPHTPLFISALLFVLVIAATLIVQRLVVSEQTGVLYTEQFYTGNVRRQS